MPELEQVLKEWNDNPQCWDRAMPGYVVEFYTLPSHLGDERLYNLIASGIGWTETPAA
ncbi:hypothetical protein ACWEKU_12480 [Streptomyces californicus]